MNSQRRLVDGAAFDAALGGLPGPDADARRAATERQGRLTKPLGALGRLEDLAVWLAGWQGRTIPELERVSCLVFAGNHGVTDRGVSAYPSDVTAQMVGNFEAGGAAINQLCGLSGAQLVVTPLHLDRPTGDITVGDAMSDEECLAAIQSGADAVPDDADVILLGEMGIGNTTAAAALAMATFGGTAGDWVGAGTGVDAAGIARKQEVVASALRRVGSLRSPFEILRRLGGRELAAIAGATIAARRMSVPVLLDGFVATAAVAPLILAGDGVLDHTMVSHLSAEAGHHRLARALGSKPLLDLGMRLGEASGAAVACLLLRAAVATHAGMATFESAGVSGRSD